MYPTPGVITLIAVTIPEEINASAVALTGIVVPIATEFWMTTVGAVVYPTPPSEIWTEVIVPAIETIVVAEAPTLGSCGINVTLFWNAKEVVLSFVGLKKGLILST